MLKEDVVVECALNGRLDGSETRHWLKEGGLPGIV